jgi:outer membrane lipoprotein-sorting protein
MKKIIYINIHLLFLLLPALLWGQSAADIIRQVKAKLDKVNDYEAEGKLKTNVVFIKAPVASVKIYYKKPDKLKIRNENGISFFPKGSVNINLNNVFANTDAYDVIDVGKEEGTGLHIIKLLPKEDNAEVVLSTLYIDEQQSLIKKARTTTRENGSYELEMTYGKYSEFGLADKTVFVFNTKEYKLPKGVTFDYEVETKKNKEDLLKNKKGKIEITYSFYIINKGISDSVFQ